jgi:polyisoprenoid-binding protein YceI
MSGITSWTLDSQHTTVEFAVRHLMIATVKGRFGDIEGTVRLDRDHPTSADVEVAIPVTSIDTRSADRDAHLRSADFFDAEQHPKMTFRSKRVELAGKQRYRLIGDLNIRGVTRDVTLDVEFAGTVKDPWGGTRAAFSATGKINRHDFGLNWNAALESGGVVVGPEVKIAIEAELVAVVGQEAVAV